MHSAIFAVLFFLAFLSGCSDSPNALNQATEETETPAIPLTGPGATSITTTAFGYNLVTLNWDDVAEATYYQVLYDIHGSGDFVQVGDDITAGTTSAAVNLPLHLIDRVDGRYRVDACNVTACDASTSIDVSSLGAAEGISYLKASNTDDGDVYGNALALSSDGTTFAVGAGGEASNATTINGDESDNSAPVAGAVYIYIRQGTTWVKQAYLKASNAETNDGFGGALSISADGNTLAIAATGEDSDLSSLSDNSVSAAGAVYIFKRTGTTWVQFTVIKAPAPVSESFARFISLSADGTVLAASAHGNATNGSNSGAIYMFKEVSGSWSHQQTLFASTPESGDQFGYSVALSGDGLTLATGAFCESSNATTIGGDQSNNSSTCAGAAYVFQEVAGTWGTPTYIKANNAGTFHYFGSDVALNYAGTTLAVAAIYEMTASSGVGGTGSGGGSLSGAVYIFQNDGTWTQQEYIKASNAEASDEFGTAIDLSDDGNILAVGTPKERSNALGIGGDESNNTLAGAGAVYIFARSGTTWEQRSYVKPTAIDVNDSFGTDVALDGAGTRLLVGVPVEDSDATGLNGDATRNIYSNGTAGAVFIY